MTKFLFTALLLAGITANAQTNTFPSSGSVGIGTTAPQAWFAGKVLELQDTRPILRLSPTSAEGIATIMLKGAYSNTAATDDEFHINYVSSTVDPRIVIGAYKNGSKTVLSLMGNGNVGLGVEYPNEKLSVKGDIRAKEVKVETTGWPDYVFKPSYKLPSLQETQAFIKQNGHLPGMPSAADIETKGQNLGEINSKLLKTVEELTLHLIEKDNLIKAQGAQLISQDKRLFRIERILAKGKKKHL